MAGGMWMDSATFGQILEWHTGMVLSQVSAMLADREPPIAREGVVVGGSFDPTDGTAEVILGDTYAIVGDDNIIPDSGTTVRRLPMLTTHLGDQYGPVGNERALLIPSQSGYHVLLHHDEDDAQAALPAGERWISHRNASGEIDAYLRLTNNGATSSDAAGGLSALAGTLLSLTTAGGLSITADDATQRVTLKAGGILLILDGQKNVLELGADSLTLANDAVVTESKAQALANAIIASVQTAFTTFAAHVQSGTGTAPPTVGPVTATGSSEVESKE
jgi:hypothetical protein